MAAVLLLVTATGASAQQSVTVLSYNVRYGTAQDGAHVWPNRRALVIDLLRDHAPQLIGIQEALRFQLDEIGAALPRFREVGVGRSDGKTAGEYAAILVDTTRFTIIGEGTFWFSDTPEVPGSMHWGNRITRISSWARLVDRLTADTVRIYNVHWDHESQPSRERSAALLLERMATDAGPNDRLLLTGDFNADETNPAFQALLADRRVPLRDSFRTLHPDAAVVGTFNGFRGDLGGGKIDAVLVGEGWEVVQAGIDRRWVGGRWPSDHFPVVAVVRRK
ncbi:MAG: endonuclease/exonuclease/phosphatase family protein [Gemmatimonadales bacterium]|nr:endonuclease/exonuclease/phosphatase family protein [Gemmatimonadales bacterium]